MTWVSRLERSDGTASLEELLAAAHASCYSMGLSHTCVENLDVSGEVSAYELGGGVREGGRVACLAFDTIRNSVEVRLHAHLQCNQWLGSTGEFVSLVRVPGARANILRKR